MKILLLTPFLPYPKARAGAPQAIYDRICLLAPHHQITVVTFIEPGEEMGVADLKRLGARVRCVVRIPSTSGLAVWRKRLRLAAALLSSSLPMLAAEFDSPRMHRLVESSILEDKPDLLLVEHMLMAQYVPRKEAVPQLPVVVSDHDVGDERATLTMGPGPAKDRPSAIVVRLSSIVSSAAAITRWMSHRWARYAEGAWRRADAVLVSSEADAAVVRRRTPSAKVEIAPFGVARHTMCGPEGPERDNSTLLFVGNFDHPPNRQAAGRLAHSIMPVVKRSCPEARLLLVGKNPTPEIRALHSSSSGVAVRGEVPSVERYLRTCALFVAPLHSGGGMRIKLMEAMMAGAPIVTTSLGARGLGAENGRHVLVADNDRAFAQAVISALSDGELRERLGREARELACDPRQRAGREAHLNEIVQRYVGA